MRTEWRRVLLPFVLFLLGAGFGVAQQEDEKGVPRAGAESSVRLTLDVSWGIPATRSGDSVGGRDNNPGTPGDVALELSAGRVIDAIAWPPKEFRSEVGALLSAGQSGMGPGAQGSRRLGGEPEGRARVRIEAPLDAVVVVQRDGQPRVTMPVVAILEKPQHTPPQSPLTVSVERVSWDSLEIDLRESAQDGIVAPGADIPVSVGLNILSTDSTEVAVRTTAVVRPIRGGDALGNYELQDRERVATNQREPSMRTWNVRAPRAEGTYVLEVTANWAATGAHEGSVLGRLIRRRRTPAVANSAVRRVLFTVVDKAAKVESTAKDVVGRETEVDSIDLTRPRSHRPLAAGRGPAAEPGRVAWPVPPEALIEPSRRDRLLGWIRRAGTEASKLEPANSSGIAWSAMGLKVAHPDRPHRLVIKVKEGEPSALGVGLIEPGGAAPGASPRLLLDACASGEVVLKDGPPTTFDWVVWPTSTEMVLLLLNRSSEAEVRLGMVSLIELDELPQRVPALDKRPTPSRAFGLYMAGSNPLEAFAASSGPRDVLATAQNLVKYLGYCGASAVVLPEQLADRSMRRALDGHADEDSTGPDRLDLVRRVLSRQGIALWLELDFTGPDRLPGLPPADSAEAARRGLVRLDRQGKPDGPEYYPLNPEVRDAMKRRVTQALTPSKPGRDNALLAAGLLIRLGSGPTLLGTPDTGLDDATFNRFVTESFSIETARGIPGTGETDPDRFAVRSQYLAGAGRMPWLTWRARAVASLYSELAEAARTAGPGTVLAVVTPALDDGPAGAEARRVDRAGLAPSQAWRSVGLDLQAWPSSSVPPAVFRGVALTSEALGHDLATSPDLDALVAGRAERGFLLTMHDGSGEPAFPPESPTDEAASRSTVAAPSTSEPARFSPTSLAMRGRNTSAQGHTTGVWLSALPLGNGPTSDEPMGHALAALDARWVFLAHKAAAGQEERLRRFAAVLHGLPAWSATPVDFQAGPTPKPFGVTVRRMNDDAQTFLEFANDSPYPIRLASLLEGAGSAPVEDRGQGLRLSPAVEAGGRRLVLDLAPYGVAAIRVGTPLVKPISITPYPSEAVLANMRLRFNELSAQLVRLNHGLVANPVEPVNSGFEPDFAAPADTASGSSTSTAKAAAKTEGGVSDPAGWRLEPSASGSDKNAISIDRDGAHSGRGSLKLAAAVAPSSVISDVFVPNVQSSLDIAVQFRGATANTKVRVWLEGESAGKPYVRRTELDVATSWELRVVRVADIPPAGIDSARLRFELMSPGTLWIDDLHIRGETGSPSQKINAQRMLLAALQAYREQRYADFARLSSSHWIRRSATNLSGRLARTNERPREGPTGSTKR